MFSLVETHEGEDRIDRKNTRFDLRGEKARERRATFKLHLDWAASNSSNFIGVEWSGNGVAVLGVAASRRVGLINVSELPTGKSERQPIAKKPARLSPLCTAHN